MSDEYLLLFYVVLGVVGKVVVVECFYVGIDDYVIVMDVYVFLL